MTNPTYRPLDLSPAQSDYLAALVQQVILADNVTKQQQDDVLASLATNGAETAALSATLHVQAVALINNAAADPDEVAKAVRLANASPLNRTEASNVISALKIAAGILTRPDNFAALLTWAEASTDSFAASLSRQYRTKGSLSAKQWSCLAEAHAAATNPAQAFTAPADGTVRYKQFNREWVVIGTPEQIVTGQQVGVTLKSGRTKNVWVGEIVLTGEGFVLASPTTKQVARELAHDIAVIPADDVAIPSGYYAVASTGNERNDLVFVRVAELPKGEVRVYQIIGGNADAPVPAQRGRDLIDRIAAVTPEVAGKQYADEIGRCWRCGRHLTDEASRDRGLGPDCAAKA